MAPKKRAAAKADKTAEGLTPERFEGELKALAKKAKGDTGLSRALGQLAVYGKALALLALLGIYANASQLAMSPVYGSIVAGAWHARVVMAGCFVGWAGNLALRAVLPMGMGTAQALALAAMWVPAAQFVLFGASQRLGAAWGPLVTEAATLGPLAVLTAASVADVLEGADLSGYPKFVAEAGPGIGSWGVFTLAEHIAEKNLARNVGTAFFYTRLGLQMLLAGAYALVGPSKYLLLGLPALIHTATTNTHLMTATATTALNGTMMAGGWMLLERGESVTGYISVAQSLESGARVLRADHSILGGDWVEFRGSEVTEPVYTVFVMLEAVRLVERETALADKDASALVIGLGIGNLPSALVAHGIDTTVVEIDPLVHEYALRHFQLRENNPAVIEDALKYTARLANETRAAAAAGGQGRTFDYIVHDVFTGGAEPVELFTLEFFETLDVLLNPGGVVAINYAGDLALPLPKMIVRTIFTVFKTCRIFRENPASTEGLGAQGTDYTNMVIFCRKPAAAAATAADGASSRELTFRRPVKADYLGSVGRKAYLMPEHEILVGDFLTGEGGGDDGYGLLRRNGTGDVGTWHLASAIGHWGIMRTVLPAAFWENW